jgi:hypothetical protein
MNSLKGNVVIMLHTFEAEMQPNGMLRFVGFDQPKYGAIQKVLVTVIPKARKTAIKPSKSTNPSASVAAKTLKVAPGWEKWMGALKDSPNFNEDPLLIQQRLRSEWS